MKRFTLALALGLSVMALAVSCASTQDKKDTVRLVTYNVGVFGKWDLSSEDYTATLMKELDPDAIALQELDSCTTRSGVERFQAETFAAAMGENWGHSYGYALKSYKEGSYGIGEVWNKDRMKMKNVFKVMLPKGEAREERALLVVEYENMVFASTHLNGNATSLQPSVEIITETLKAKYGESDMPVFLGGDFNARPDNPSIEYMRQNWTILTPVGATGVGGKNRGVEPAPQTIEEVQGGCIDYIMLLNNKAEVELLDSQICFKFENGSAFESSDHLPVFVDVRF